MSDAITRIGRAQRESREKKESEASPASSCSRWSMHDYGTRWLINTDSAHVEGYGITKKQAEAITEILNANTHERES
jgi:hypothetical protein